jgi:hypothetical protein
VSGAELLVVITVAVGWPGVLIKIPDLVGAPHDRAQRALFGSLLGFTAATTAELTPVYLWIGRTLHYGDLARLVVHTLVIIGACCLQVALLHWRYPPQDAQGPIRRRVIVFTAVLAAMILTFVLDWTSTQVIDVPNRFFDANLWLIVYSLIWYGYLAYAMASILYNAHLYRRQLARGLTWFGLWLMQIAGALGIVFCAHQVARMFADNAEHPLPWDEVLVGNLLMAATVITLELSIVLPSLVARLLDVPGGATRRRDAATLAPLWEDLTGVFPQYQLTATRPGLNRMLTEVASGLLALAVYTDPAVEDAARAAIDDHGQTEGAGEPLLVEATRVRCAVIAARYGWQLPREVNAPALTTGTGTEEDPVADRRHFLALAAAYRSPVADQVAAAYEAQLMQTVGDRS